MTYRKRECTYCGVERQNHEGKFTTTVRHVRVESGPVNSLKGTVYLHGGCYRKAKNDDDWHLGIGDE